MIREVYKGGFWGLQKKAQKRPKSVQKGPILKEKGQKGTQKGKLSGKEASRMGTLSF